MRTINHRFIPIGSPQMQEQILRLVESGDMEPVQTDDGVTTYRLTQQGLLNCEPIIETHYNLTGKGHLAVRQMKRGDC
jgi:hypothetical protein